MLQRAAIPEQYQEQPRVDWEVVLMLNLPPFGEPWVLICSSLSVPQVLCGPFRDDIMIFKFHLKSCLPSALRSLILQKKPNTRNMSNMSRGEWC